MGDRTLRILGVDPGSQVTGYGVVEREGSQVRHVAHGTLRPPRRESLARRLAVIADGLREVVSLHQPEVVVVEKAFVGSNPRTALALGQARGAALAVLGGAGLGLEELSPAEIKRAVVGTGRADKRQVQLMVKRLLGLGSLPAEDAADALAAAICRGHRGAQEPRRVARPRPRGGARRSGSELVVRRAR